MELAPLDALDRFVEDTALVADQDAFDGDAERVTLITLHAAKGLEWPTVFISGLTEGLFPHSRALMDQEQMEEERRLCYVGITRAKRRLSLSYALRRGWGDGDGAPSRFLAEIPEELLDVANDDDPRADGETRFGRGFRSGGSERRIPPWSRPRGAASCLQRRRTIWLPARPRYRWDRRGTRRR
jgi:DNA helicase-2/ATP-dependent DNA helicase PcrA